MLLGQVTNKGPRFILFYGDQPGSEIYIYSRHHKLEKAQKALEKAQADPFWATYHYKIVDTELIMS